MSIFSRVIICFLFVSHSLFCRLIEPRLFSDDKHKEKVEIIINFIFEELIKKTSEMPTPEFLKPKKTSVNNMKRGSQLIEEMKRRNREKIAKMRGINPDKVKSGKDLVKAQKDDNKNLIKAINEKIDSAEKWNSLAQSEISLLRKQVISDWKEKHKIMIEKWEKEKKNFKSQESKYADNTFELPLILPVDKDERNKKIDIKIEKEFHVVSSAMSVPVRDQKYRPTCGAFSGLRIVEILMAQNKIYNDLSEQYFYWASKKDCQSFPCRRKGSWVGHGLKYSQNKRLLDIPSEKNCPYNIYSKEGNETQIPLKNGCDDGVIKISSFHYLKNLSQVMKALDQHKPVNASIYLTPNFYSSQSLILEQDKNKGDKNMDLHAQGHSVVIVGYVKLPQVLNEGNVCFITVNSWGEGWGRGGYSCISEKWMIHQRQKNPFVVVSKATI